MKTEAEIKKRLDDIMLDDRLKRAPASVEVNAPLALIQCSLEAIVSTLKWVLKEEG